VGCGDVGRADAVLQFRGRWILGQVSGRPGKQIPVFHGTILPVLGILTRSGTARHA
jgi:hypothetical protein